ncbi:hypothetical protein DUNSADRAFT_13499 [Dunaliella salina]|uniref:Encoded protein n=1 Tax=Dunaliella salina TaxID=3046 RepID=A0ABQ7G991_DUNSA|nr:hypothetical protein DUNSADRAFT_13499 [Dunaliella salina]|eukprot:KAF5831170.1 hypothetical protein DUNSADRAFT_13499 [Dunaliella salina]
MIQPCVNSMLSKKNRRWTLMPQAIDETREPGGESVGASMPLFAPLHGENLKELRHQALLSPCTSGNRMESTGLKKTDHS